MGLYDRDYGRSYDTGSGWRDGGGSTPGGFALPTTANGKLLLAMAIVYAAQWLFQPWFTEAFVLPSDWLEQPWRAYGLISYGFLHSPSNIFHLLFNGLALYFFGRTIEARVGGKEYVTFFVAAVVFAGLTWSLVEVALGSNAPQPRSVAGELVMTQSIPTLLGASGGIAAVLILFALCYPHVQVHLMGIVPVPAWLMAVIFLVLDISGALDRSGNVAYTAHLGGALFGFLYFQFGWRLSRYLPDWLGGGTTVLGNANSKRFELKSLFKRKPKLRVHREDDADDSVPEDRVDEVLRKIKAQGQDSLTAEERRILERASRRYQQRRN